MTLDLRNIGILDPERAVELKSAFDLIDEVEEYVEKELGVTEYKQPPTAPPDLSEGLADRADALTNDELGVLHAQYVAYAAFLNARLARIKAAYKVSESNLKHITADLTNQLFAKKKPKNEVESLVKSDALYRQFEVEYLKLYMMREIMEARYTAYSDQAKAISRLITLRVEEMETQRASAQRGRRPRPSGRFG